MVGYFELFWTFFKIGLFTFGGGAAMLPLLKREVVERKHWAGDEELLDYYSIGQCTPGIIAINTATFIGYKMRGVFGAILTTFGVVVPSVIIITLVAAVLQNFMDNEYVEEAFAGVRLVVVALILQAVSELWIKGVKGKIGVAFFVLALGLLVFFNLSPVLVILIASAAGLAYLRGIKK